VEPKTVLTSEPNRLAAEALWADVIDFLHRRKQAAEAAELDARQTEVVPSPRQSLDVSQQHAEQAGAIA
jgi:hypothetical protein